MLCWVTAIWIQPSSVTLVKRLFIRLFVEAVLYRYRAGIPWRDLPERFDDFRIIHTRFCRWSRTGVWERVFAACSAESDNEYAMIDSTIVRAHQHSAGAKKGGRMTRELKRLGGVGAD